MQKSRKHLKDNYVPIIAVSSKKEQIETDRYSLISRCSRSHTLFQIA